jgi:hypothetical protein
MLTPEEKLLDIQRQCDRIWETGVPQPIDCPYCYMTTPPQSLAGPCCGLMDKAIKAILERKAAVDEGMKAYERREFGREIMGAKYLN